MQKTAWSSELRQSFCTLLHYQEYLRQMASWNFLHALPTFPVKCILTFQENISIQFPASALHWAASCNNGENGADRKRVQSFSPISQLIFKGSNIAQKVGTWSKVLPGSESRIQTHIYFYDQRYFYSIWC